MRKREINLINTREVLTTQDELVEKITKVYVPIALSAAIFLLICIFGYSVYVKTQINRTDTQIAEIRGLIAAREKDEGLYVTLKQKLLGLSSIFANRYPYNEVLAFLNQLRSEKISFSTVQLGKNGTITLEVFANNSLDVDGLSRKILAAAEKRFSTVELINAQYTTENTYALTFSMQTKSTFSL